MSTPRECPNCGTVTEEAICPNCQTALEEELSLDEEFGLEFEEQLAVAEENAELSSHTEEMAFGFPDWDLLPPKGKK
jgi:hypothetical protein